MSTETTNGLAHAEWGATSFPIPQRDVEGIKMAHRNGTGYECNLQGIDIKVTAGGTVFVDTVQVGQLPDFSDTSIRSELQRIVITTILPLSPIAFSWL